MADALDPSNETGSAAPELSLVERARVEHAHGGPVRALAVIPGPDGTPTGFISGGNDGYLRRWDPDLQTSTATPQRAHDGTVWSVAVIPGPDGTPTGFISGGNDGYLRRWDPDLQNSTATPQRAHDGTVLSVAVIPGPDGTPTGFISGGNDGYLRRWDPDLQNSTATPQRAHDGTVWSVAVIPGPDGTPTGFISGGNDGYLRRWDPDLQNSTATPQRAHDGTVLSVAVIPGPDGTPTGFISGGNDGYLRRWDPDLQNSTATPQRAHDGTVWSVAVIPGPDGTPTGFISGGDDGYLRRWDPDLQTSTATPQRAHDGAVLSVAVIPGPDGTPTGFISGGDDGAIALWNRVMTLTLGTATVEDVPVPLSGGATGGLRGEGNLTVTAATKSEDKTSSAKPEATIGTRVSVDALTTEDRLSRGELAGHLQGVLSQFVKAHQAQAGSEHFSAEGSQSVVIAVSGRWGSGKTKLAEMLVDRLQQLPMTDVDRSIQVLADPVVVRFDAWRNREVGPEWWALGSSVYRGLLGERALPARWAMAVVSATRRVLGSTALLTGAIVIGLLLGFGGGLLDRVGSLATSVAGVAIAIAVATRLLFWASPTLGTLNQKAEDAPAMEIAEIMSRLRRWSPRSGVAHGFWDSFLAISLGAIGGAGLLWHFGPASPPAHIGLGLLAAAVAAALSVSILILVRPRPMPPRRTASIVWTPISIMILGVLLVILGAFDGAWRSQWWSTHVVPVATAADIPWPTVLIFACCALAPYLAWQYTRLARPRRAVLLIVDELDRCDADKTVRYLSAVHTLLRHYEPPRTFRRWREPAPLMILLLADDRWVRQAFTTHFSDFCALGDGTIRDLGSDFLQKLIDHTVLVPQLSGDQIRSYAEFVTESPEVHANSANQSAAGTPTTPNGLGSDSGTGTQSDDGSNSGGELLRGFDAEVVASASATLESLPKDTETLEREIASVPIEQIAVLQGLARSRGMGMQVREALAARKSGEDGARLQHRELLNEHAHVLPANPRLIRRCANAATMLDAMTESLGLRLPKDHIARAGIFYVRFPNLVDQLLSHPVAPAFDASTWGRADVAECLRLTPERQMSLQELARCFGKEYLPEPPSPPRSTVPPAQSEPYGAP